MTRFLTEAVKSWAYARPSAARSDRPAAYCELALPVTPGAAEYGRLDLVVMLATEPGIAIEIDSDTNPESAHKLVFAREAGATAVWMRWRRGSRTETEGIHLIDLG